MVILTVIVNLLHIYNYIYIYITLDHIYYLINLSLFIVKMVDLRIFPPVIPLSIFIFVSISIDVLTCQDASKTAQKMNFSELVNMVLGMRGFNFQPGWKLLEVGSPKEKGWL